MTNAPATGDIVLVSHDLGEEVGVVLGITSDGLVSVRFADGTRSSWGAHRITPLDENSPADLVERALDLVEPLDGQPSDVEADAHRAAKARREAELLRLADEPSPELLARAAVILEGLEQVLAADACDDDPDGHRGQWPTLWSAIDELLDGGAHASHPHPM